MARPTPLSHGGSGWDTYIESVFTDLYGGGAGTPAPPAAYLPFGNAIVDVVTGYGAKVDGATDDTAAWQAAINAVATAGGGTVFCSKRGVSLIHGSQVTGTAFSYSYSGQLLFPAVAGTASRVTIRLLGPVPPAGPVDAAASEPATTAGVVLLSNATSGNIIDCIPGYSVPGPSPFTNINAFFENVTVRGPNNPQCGGVKLVAAACSGSRGFTVDVDAASSSTTYPTGSGVGLSLPGPNNMATVTHVDPNVTGWPVAYLTSEHAVLVAPKVFQCGVGFRHNAHLLHKARVVRAVVAQCPIPIQAVNSGQGGGCLEGDFDLENDSAPWAVTALVDDIGNRLVGNVSIYVPGNPTVGLPIIGGQAVNITNPALVRQRSALPADTFTRLVDVANSMGLSDISAHPWVSLNGSLQTSAGKCQIGSSGATSWSIMQYFLPTFGSRTLTASITTGTTIDIGLVTKYVFGGTNAGSYLTMRFIGTTVYLQRYNSGLGTYTTLATSSAGAVAVSTTYRVVLTLSWTPTGGVITAYVNGTQVATYTLVSGDLTALAESTSTAPGQAGDGVWINTDDVGSYCSLLQVSSGAA